MKRHTFTLTLHIQGPVLTKSSSPSSFGIDAAVARVTHGPDQGKPCIHGSHLRGKIRESLEQLYSPALANALLGQPSQKGTDDEPVRTRLILGDLVHAESKRSDTRRHRIAIEPDLGSVKHGALQVIETPFAAGEEAIFTGPAWFYGDDASDAQRKLLHALRWLTHIGANRTTGFGKLLGATVQLEPAAESNAATPTFTKADTSLCVVLQPHGPLCISRHKIGGNLHESEDFIPGNMLAGAVMETAKILGISLPHFDLIRFRHAFPSSCSERPAALPLSLMQVGKDHCYDVASLRDPVLIHNQAPAFQTDWKSDSKAREKYHAASPARELRVRTKIDSELRTADRGDDLEGGKLFAWELIHPLDSQGTQLTWHSQIDLHAVPEEDRAALATNLATVLAQLGFLSKTKALCTGTVQPVRTESAPELHPGDTLRLVLQTPALLADPRFQDLPGVPKHGALEAADMLALYRSVWHELSDGSLFLSHHYADQSLAGGNYLATRFQKQRSAYDPWLLTSAGSVFVFQIVDAKALQPKLSTWLATGLPLPDWAKSNFGADWKTNPYLPQNGFGEIALHEFRFAPPPPEATQHLPLSVSILPPP